jgi:hypothetical protein
MDEPTQEQANNLNKFNQVVQKQVQQFTYGDDRKAMLLWYDLFG